MRGPVFSVILPTHHRPSSLLSCLTGLAKLAYPRDSYEVIVVNDGRRMPEGPVMAQATEGLALTVLQQDHRGPAVARNAGAARAAGRYLAFIDDDCVPDRGWLAALERRLAVEPDALVGGRTVNALTRDAYSDASQLLVDFMAHYHDASGPERTRFFATSNLTVPTDRFRELGGFDVQFALAGGEDREFCDRWHTGGGRSAYEPDAIVYHRHHLGLGRYLAQHFRYGRGALHFHRVRKARHSGEPRTPARFYLDLVLYPLAHRPPATAAGRAALLLAAQAATAAGYCWERLTAAPIAARD